MTPDKPLATLLWTCLWILSGVLLPDAAGAVPRHACHDDCGGGSGGANEDPIASEGPAACVGGMAGSFPCNDVDLAYWLSIGDIGGGEGNDCWGWTHSPSGREFAIYGRTTGTSFVEITVPTSPIYLGNLPTHSAQSIWRDAKVYADHAFIVSEDSNHGLQIFDLTELLTVPAPPITFTETAHDDGFGNAHNIAINEATGYGYVVGADMCSGGLYMIDVSTPAAPTFAGCFADDGYTHDVQCVVYAGSDAEHAGKEICFAANEDSLTIVDVTNKLSPVMLSSTDYAGRRYTHQAWPTDDHAWLLLDDELDERDNGHNTRTHLVDLADLDAPLFGSSYTSHLAVIDHNQYVLGGHTYQANYTAGLRILDIGEIAQGDVCEVASFDVHPATDDVDFYGAWSNYPYFPSGTVIVSSTLGLAILEPQLAGAVCIPPPPVVQTPTQRRCIDAMNKGGTKVATAQGRLNAACIEDGGDGSVADPQACLDEDESGKVDKAKTKTIAAEVSRCDPIDLPTFGYTSAATVNSAAIDHEKALTADVFGSDLNASIILAEIDPDGASCQSRVARSYEKIVRAELKVFRSCKKAGLKSGSIDAPIALADCFDEVVADPKDKIGKSQEKVVDAVAGKCAGVDPAVAFPGACMGAGDLAACIIERVDCRVCRAVNEMDDIERDCDLFDDDTANASCPP